jgi:hypothetical protein
VEALQAKETARPAVGSARDTARPRRQEADATIAEPVRRDSRPIWLIGLGFLFAALIVVGIIIFFTRSGNTYVQIVLDTKIDAELLKDGSVKYFLDGAHLPPEKLRAPIELTPGQHTLIGKRGDVEVQRYVFVVARSADGKEATIQVKEKTPYVPPAAAFAGDGWITLFDGKDLSSWRGTGWMVRDDYVVVGKGDLVTREDFGPDYDLHVEFWVPLMEKAKGQGRGNSGVYLNGAWEIQILDSFHLPPGMNSCGALYGSAAPRVNACKPPETWQTFDISFSAPRDGAAGKVSVVHNGIPILDNIPVNDGTLKSLKPGRPRTGPIMLQDHGSPVRFRNIKIRPRTPAAPKELPEGWIALFNGKDLTGWKTHADQPGGWSVEGGELVGRSSTAHHLFSERGDFEDFELHAEVKLNKEGNSGVYFRSNFSVARGGKFPDAYEVQLLNWYPQPTPLTGSLNPWAKKKDASAINLKPPPNPDEWFKLDVTARGGRLIVKVNDIVSVDVLDNDKTYRAGHICLQAMNDNTVKGTTVVRFRDVRIRPLQPAPVAKEPAPIQPPAGFTALFNGKDLTGWRGGVPLPKLSPEELKNANSRVLPRWSVQDEMLVYDGKGNKEDGLQTSQAYENFELMVDWKIEPGGDTGILLRGVPQVQIWDRAEGSGGLYNNVKNPSKPLIKADHPPGEWNTFHIKLQGDRAWITLNGKSVVENTQMENFWNRALPLPKSGPIELQQFTGRAWFRNVWIKELK